MATAFAAHGLRQVEARGFKPVAIPDLIRAVLARRRGEVGDDDIARLVEFELEGAPLVTYLGYAIKEREPRPR